jgi:hypothetical protein
MILSYVMPREKTSLFLASVRRELLSLWLRVLPLDGLEKTFSRRRRR